LAVKLTSEGRVRLWALWRSMWPVFLGGGTSRCRTWWGLYPDEWKRFSSSSSSSSSSSIHLL